MYDTRMDEIDYIMSTYERFVDRSVVLPNDTMRERLILGGFGLATEAGEAGDIIKKHTLFDKPLDRVKLQEELGDTLWHMTLLVDTLGLRWSEIFEQNVEKLEDRHLSGKPLFYTPDEDYGDAGC